jgi:hypothetical protein
MHVHLRPIVSQPVAAPRPVPNLAPSPVQPGEIKRVTAPGGGGGQQGGAGRRRDDRRDRPKQGDEGDPRRGPAAALAARLAALDLEHLFGTRSSTRTGVTHGICTTDGITTGVGTAIAAGVINGEAGGQ